MHRSLPERVSVTARPTRRALLGSAVGLGLLLTERAFAEQAAPRRAPARAPNPVEQAVDELARWARAQKAELGASVLDLQSGRELAAVSSERALNPASNQKILTICAALETLGPGHRFVTSLHGRQSGAVLSELVLRSDGDPDLSTADLAEFVHRLRRMGVQRVEGDIFVDQSAFDRQWEPPAYEQRPDDWASYRSPVSAVAIDNNALVLHVVPTAEGKPALAWVEPSGIAELSGAIATEGRNTRSDVRLTVSPNGEKMRVLVGGKVPSHGPALAYARRIAAPERAPGHILHALLAQHGIPVTGKVKSGGAGFVAELVRLESRPLSELVHALGKQSNNFVAEMLLKAMGRSGSEAGTSQKGAAVIQDMLRRLRALTPGTRITNGSGLYDANRISAFTLTRVLAHARTDPKVGPELLAALSIGGTDGTLSSRLAAFKSARTVRAKTGTLASVVTLAGYILGPSPLAFAFLLNGVGGKVSESRRRIDMAVAKIAS
ncbi:MAG TPA: D-alanyl-D-alanine carboxypeptidase/D-alanyl-D-alanine-endopeptidase [Polyangiaceae bacterium]|nr:D-alanyl-D-alanine carboxypeptidase/D-alanyl-D-alanine-endopeptidase [Polyangiaceae bacterium]